MENGSLPTTDPFAAAPHETAVLPYCWLGQVLGYQMWCAGGNDGLILAHAMLETLAAGILMLAVWRRGARLSGGVVGSCFAVLSLPILGTIRPQLFSQVCLALVLLACAELPSSRRPLYWLPIVFALWANLHATMIIGLGVIGVMGLGEMWRAYQAKKKIQDVLADVVVRRFILAGVIGLVAACLNPHGPLMFIEALTFGRTGAVNHVSEWQAMSPKSITGGVLIGSTVIAFLAIYFSKGKQPLRWHELALLVLFGIATLGAIRMLVWWAIVWPYVVIPMIAMLFEQRSDEPETSELPRKPPPCEPRSPCCSFSSRSSVLRRRTVCCMVASVAWQRRCLDRYAHSRDGRSRAAKTGRDIHRTHRLGRLHRVGIARSAEAARLWTSPSRRGPISTTTARF